MFSITLLAAVLFAQGAVYGSMSNHHLLLGPTFPPPRLLITNDNFLFASSQLSSQLRSSLEQGKTPFGNLTPGASSVSISMTSTAQESTIFDFNFTGSSLNVSAGGTDQVSGDSVFRIGSISKLLTVYAFLLNDGMAHWGKPVTNYVPEICQAAQRWRNNSELDYVRWEEVTLGDLASHMSGISRDDSAADLSFFPMPWTQYGLPQLDSAKVPKCGVSENDKPCAREEYFQSFIERHPVFLPQSTPIYSNTAFRILSYAIEAIANDSFENIMKRSFIEPLSLAHTTYRKPKNSLGVIPEGDSNWAYDLGDETPDGGIYSSSSDLAILARHIMLNTQLPPHITRRWMKPLSHTSALTLSVGAPWEILRTKTNIISGHTIDLYTKSGSIGLYNSLLILIPDYEVAISILTAGPDSTVMTDIAEMLTQTFIPVLQQASGDEAARNIAGTYGSDVGLNSSIQLSVADDGQGLVIQSWISNGADILATAEMYAQATNGGSVKLVRICPTNLVSRAGDVVRVAFRATFDTVTDRPAAVRAFDWEDNMWGKIDQITYGKIAVDDFVIEFDADGRAVSIEQRFLGVRLFRVQRGECWKSDFFGNSCRLEDQQFWETG